MPKYKKRADGRYQANVQIGIDKETGKRIFAPTIYAYSIQELENKKAEIKDQVNKGIYADDKRMTVGEWAGRWFKTDKATAGIRTKEMYERIVFSHIIPVLGDIRLMDLKKSDIQTMINNNADHFRTCEQIRMTVKQMLYSAIDEGLLYKNVGLNIKLPPKYKSDKRPLNETEKAAIKKTDFTAKEKAFIYIILYCGLRRGEVLALSRNDIDMKHREINIMNAVTFDHGNPVLKPYPKSFAGIRTVDIPDELLIILDQYLKQIPGLFLFEMERKNSLMSKSSYDKFWGNIVRKINAAAGGNNDLEVIHGLTAHVFRHNYATMLYYNEIDVMEAQKLLGHSSIKITLDIYTHLDKTKRKAKEKLSNLSAL